MRPPRYELLRRALELAAWAHDGQVRKFGPPGGRLQYVIHPVRVMLFLQDMNYRVEALAAALLHDVLEDCSDTVTPGDIKRELGEEVQLLVLELTNPTHTPEWAGKTREEKKAADREKIANVSRLAKVIKLVDRLDNVREMDHAPEAFRRKYVEETRALVALIGEAHRHVAELIELECDRLEAGLTQPV